MLTETPGRMIKHYGKPCTLWRRDTGAGANAWTAGALTDTFHPCHGAARVFRNAYVIKGTLQEQARRVVIDAASIGVVPRAGDRVAAGTHAANGPGIEWREVTTAPDVVSVGGTVTHYVLQVSG